MFHPDFPKPYAKTSKDTYRFSGPSPCTDQPTTPRACWNKAMLQGMRLTCSDLGCLVPGSNNGWGNIVCMMVLCITVDPLELTISLLHGCFLGSADRAKLKKILADLSLCNVTRSIVIDNEEGMRKCLSARGLTCAASSWLAPSPGNTSCMSYTLSGAQTEATEFLVVVLRSPLHSLDEGNTPAKNTCKRFGKCEFRRSWNVLS